jgi:hypothetical protein
MELVGADRLSCVVCGIETKRHAGWFLVMDNCWLDRVKILTWHPVLAREKGMRSVCGKPHLKALLTHWFHHADLQLGPCQAGRVYPDSQESSAPLSYARSLAAGKMLGELAVERNPRSAGWTGSPETMEYILNALISEADASRRSFSVSSIEQLGEYSPDPAYR